MPTRDLSNKRVQVVVGPANMVADLSAPKESELALMLHGSAAIRWNGLDFGVQASDKVDDRSLDDDASAQLRGFTQYGGGVPVFYPKITDTGSVLRRAYNLFKEQGTPLAWIERVGWKSTQDEIVAGDNVNTYLVTTDGFKPDTEGDGGYAYLLTMLAQGIAYPWTIGAATQALAVGAVALRQATYLGNDITLRAAWRSSDETVARVEKGIIVGVKAGTANVYATFPGATESTAIAVTVA
jgi:hypothetical protein